MGSLKTNFHSFGEIESQPEAWSQIIPLVLSRAEPIQQIFNGIEEVIFAGCGSGLNVSISGAPVMQAKAQISAKAIPALDVYKFSESVLNKKRKTLAILSSRSGKTTEVVNALHHLCDQGIPTLGITCTEGSPLALESTLSLVLSPVIEQAVITTRSLTGMILVTQLITAIAAQDEAYLSELRQLPEICSLHMQSFHDLGQVIGQRTDLTRYSFLANGPLYGAAHESQLKIKEMVLLPCDCYPALDFRHGPQSNVNEQMLVTVLFSDSASQEEAHLLEDMKALDGVTWAICDQPLAEGVRGADYLLQLNSGLGEYARIILYLPAIQYMAYYRTLTSGLNPDKPHNLVYWVDSSH
jgi:glucosamine--fructose-6-phosphate aminotransferase (isomerizing)